MEKVDGGLKNAQKSYDEAIRKPSTGSDTLIRKAERLKELGAKADKNIPEKYIPATLIAQQTTLEDK